MCLNPCAPENPRPDMTPSRLDTVCLGAGDFTSEAAFAAYQRLLTTLREREQRAQEQQEQLQEHQDQLQEMNALYGDAQKQVHVLAQELQQQRAATVRVQRLTNDMRANLIETEGLATLGAMVASVAHEINTPVGITLTAASFLADKLTELAARFAQGQLRRSDFQEHLDTASESCAIILANSRRAADLIHSFKQVAADQTNAERQEFHLRPCLEDIVRCLSPRIRQRGHTVMIECPETLVVDGYPGPLSQVLTNLFMNSLNHAYPPGVTGTLTLSARAHDAEHIELCYRDDGCGISDDHVARIFDPFFTTRRGAGGTGLGLHIVYTIVTEILRGRITVSSAPRQGCTFTIIFPFRFG